MRDLTAEERVAMQAGRCPFCGEDEFREGPSGGMSVNIQCCGCLRAFNVAFAGGTLFVAELISE